MQVSAEIRWFWRGAPPLGLEIWFCNVSNHSCPVGRMSQRVDEYLRDPNQVELGIKRRGTKKGIEIKGLVAVASSGLTVQPFTGPIEVWGKWLSESLELIPGCTIVTEKVRWLRAFDTTTKSPQEIPLDEHENTSDVEREFTDRGCNVELTQIRINQDVIWWTLGFEAFGALSTIEDDLRSVAALMASRRPPKLSSGIEASYPMWLKEYRKGSGNGDKGRGVAGN